VSEQFSERKLYVVSTPIGNLRDITLRALDVLAHVDIIAAEDTRVSKRLLDHFQISTSMICYHDHNKERVAPRLLTELENNRSVAIITDAGTPGISDPAFYLIRMVVEHEYPVEAIPGATAVIPALIISGLPTDRFVFEGFLPVKKGRQTRLQELKEDPRTLIFYESPYRVHKTIRDLCDHFGDRPLVIARELTKMHEQIIYTSLRQIQQEESAFPLKGEFVLVVGGLTRKLKTKLG
jgi:16S rRNA (cytidine1402-2'-O)-methyltransferase